MKYKVLVPALLILAGNAVADNTINVDAAVEAYVANGLMASNEAPLKFPDIVRPAAGAGNYTVTVDPSSGDVSYTGKSAPGGNQNSQNTTGSSVVGQRAHQVGVIKVTGEPGYAYSMTINVKDLTAVPQGMSYASLIDGGTTTGIAGTANLQLDAVNGISDVKYGGTLTVGETTPSGTSLVNLVLNATISYR